MLDTLETCITCHQAASEPWIVKNGLACDICIGQHFTLCKICNQPEVHRFVNEEGVCEDCQAKESKGEKESVN